MPYAPPTSIINACTGKYWRIFYQMNVTTAFFYYIYPGERWCVSTNHARAGWCILQAAELNLQCVQLNYTITQVWLVWRVYIALINTTQPKCLPFASFYYGLWHTLHGDHSRWTQKVPLSVSFAAKSYPDSIMYALTFHYYSKDKKSKTIVLLTY